MNLIIDVGNTRVKVALFEGDTIYSLDSFDLRSLLSQLQEICNLHAVERAIISTVANIEANDLDEIKKMFPTIVLNHQTKVPFTNNYATKNTLGVDRIALAAAAVKNYPDKNVLVIDAGTCITADFVTSEGVFLGGTISPGILMRYRALHHFTDKLPELQRIENVRLVGDSTENSIHSGVINGVVYEIKGIIEEHKLIYDKITVVLTGGDAIFLAKRFKSSIFANPIFLMEGLNYILTQNSKND